MDAKLFLQESKRMCLYYGGTENCTTKENNEECPFRNRRDFMCDILFPDADIVDVVEQWSKEHPKVTNLDKLHQMFPDVPFNINGCTGIDCKEGICLNRDKCEWNNFWCQEYKGGNI